MTTPLSAQQVVVRLSLYLVLAANWPLWLQITRIGGAPSLYLRSAAALAVLTACGTVAILAFTAWTLTRPAIQAACAAAPRPCR